MRLKIYAGGEPSGPSHSKSRSAQNAAPPAVRNVSSKDPDKSELQQHKVQPGETLYSIAHNFKTTVSALKQSNPFLSGRSLEAGDVLTVQP